MILPIPWNRIDPLIVFRCVFSYYVTYLICNVLHVFHYISLSLGSICQEFTLLINGLWYFAQNQTMRRWLFFFWITVDQNYCSPVVFSRASYFRCLLSTCLLCCCFILLAVLSILQASPASSSMPALEAPMKTPSRVRFYLCLMHDLMMITSLETK